MQYWESIRPQNLADIFRRYLFSFMSVHTTWQGNVRGYNSIKEFDSWIDNKESLRDKLRTSGVGPLLPQNHPFVVLRYGITLRMSACRALTA